MWWELAAPEQAHRLEATLSGQRQGVSAHFEPGTEAILLSMLWPVPGGEIEAPDDPSDGIHVDEVTVAAQGSFDVRGIEGIRVVGRLSGFVDSEGDGGEVALGEGTESAHSRVGGGGFWRRGPTCNDQSIGIIITSIHVGRAVAQGASGIGGWTSTGLGPGRDSERGLIRKRACASAGDSAQQGRVEGGGRRAGGQLA